MGLSRTICTNPVSPTGIVRSSKVATRALTSSAPRCKCTGVQWRKGRSSDGSIRTRASNRSLGAWAASLTIQSPRDTSSLVKSGPAMFNAQRSPASPDLESLFCAWIARTRTSIPWGVSIKRSPTAACPAYTVPVTTKPDPVMVKARSMARRKLPALERRSTLRAAATRCIFNSTTPSPVMPDTGKIGAPARLVPSINCATSAAASARRVSSTRSIFVNATAPTEIPNKSRMARCSKVCGIGPSSAATINIAKSMAPTPASMLRTNFSCPGTSTNPNTKSSSRDSYAKPRSMVRPRFCSSGNRSASTPVNAFTNDVLPWSICPAVAIIMKY